MIGEKRLGVKKSANIVEPIRDDNNFNPDDNGNLTFKYGREDIHTYIHILICGTVFCDS